VPDNIKTGSNAIRAPAEAAQSPRDLTETDHHTNAARLKVRRAPRSDDAARSRVLQVVTGDAAAFRKNRAR
jgi:predicted phage tail protein